MLRVNENARQYLLGIKYKFRSLMEYRASFLAFFITDATWALMAVIFWYAIFQGTNTINGWTFYGSMLMLVFVSIAELMWDSFDSSQLSQGVIYGDLDKYLAKPISLPTFWWGWSFDPSFMSRILIIAGYLYLALPGINLSWLLVGLVYTILGVIAFLAIELSLVSLAFWFGRIGRLLNLFYNLVWSQHMFPVAIYPTLWKLVFTILIPIGLFQSIPAQIVLDPSTLWKNLALLIPTLIGWLLVASIMWKEGLKRYESAGG